MVPKSRLKNIYPLAVALAEAAKVAARMALALAVVERVAVGLRRWWKEGGGEALEARAAAVWAAVERVGEAVARLVKEAEEREAAAMEAARSVGVASRRVRQ